MPGHLINREFYSMVVSVILWADARRDPNIFIVAVPSNLRGHSVARRSFVSNATNV